MIISIFGPDGVGKTTHADMLANELARQGYKVKRVWVKNNHTIAYLIIVLLNRISRRNVIVLPSNSILTNILACSSKIASKLWLWIDLIGAIIKLIFSVYIPRLLGFIVVADRYLPDTIVAMTLTLRDFKILKTIPIKLLLSMLRRDNTIMIMLDCNYELIKSRRVDLVEPRPLILWQKIKKTF